MTPNDPLDETPYTGHGTGNPPEDIKSVMDLMTPAGATQLGAALEAFSNTNVSARLTSLLRNGKDKGAP